MDSLYEQEAAPGMFRNAESCSVCLEPVADSGDRSIARLKCGHHFHLDCIGSAFNAKGAMQCPNCRSIEEGQWLYATGVRLNDDFWGEDVGYDDDFEFYQASVVPTGDPFVADPFAHHFEWCPYQHASGQVGGSAYPHLQFSVGEGEVSARYPGLVVNLSYNYESSPSSPPQACPFLAAQRRHQAQADSSRARVTSAGGPPVSSAAPGRGVHDLLADVDMRDVDLLYNGNSNLSGWRPANPISYFGTDTQDPMRVVEMPATPRGGGASSYAPPSSRDMLLNFGRTEPDRAASLAGGDPPQHHYGNGSHMVEGMNSAQGLCPRPGYMPGQAAATGQATAQGSYRRAVFMGGGSSSNSSGSPSSWRTRPSSGGQSSSMVAARAAAAALAHTSGDLNRRAHNNLVVGEVSMGLQEQNGMEAHGQGGNQGGNNGGQGGNQGGNNGGQGFVPWRRETPPQGPFWTANAPAFWGAEPFWAARGARAASDLRSGGMGMHGEGGFEGRNSAVQPRQTPPPPPPPADFDFGVQSVYMDISRSFGFEGGADVGNLLSQTVPGRPSR